MPLCQKCGKFTWNTDHLCDECKGIKKRKDEVR